jgi:hypothetical protein
MTLSSIHMARILIIAACLCASGAPLFSQTQNNPTPQPEQNRPNLFEPVPPAQPLAVGPNVIEGVEFRGARRIPQDILRTTIVSKVGIFTTQTRFAATSSRCGTRTASTTSASQPRKAKRVASSCALSSRSGLSGVNLALSGLVWWY